MRKWITIGLIITLVFLVGFVVLAYMFRDFREATRDIAIILFAVTGLIAALVAVAILVAILFAVNKIRAVTNETIIPQTQVLQTKVEQILDNVTSMSDSARSSVASVSTTANYASEQVVTPIIKVAGLVAGARAGAAFLARRGAPDND